MNRRSFLTLSFLFFIFFSCKDKIATTTEVYRNSFETGDLNNITGGLIETYNRTKVLGRYYNEGFSLNLNDLPKHDMLSVSFDLYIHDSWDGNTIAPAGPDIWEMYVDGDPYISTTFSNYPCSPTDICPPQSYPNSYPNNYNQPKAGISIDNLPAACKTTYPNGSVMYRIKKTFAHSAGNVTIKCLDKLNQGKCDESWSVDNLVVKATKL